LFPADTEHYYDVPTTLFLMMSTS